MASSSPGSSPRQQSPAAVPGRSSRQVANCSSLLPPPIQSAERPLALAGGTRPAAAVPAAACAAGRRRPQPRDPLPHSRQASAVSSQASPEAAPPPQQCNPPAAQSPQQRRPKAPPCCRGPPPSPSPTAARPLPWRTWPRLPVRPMTFITIASFTGVSCRRQARGNVGRRPRHRPLSCSAWTFPRIAPHRATQAPCQAPCPGPRPWPPHAHHDAASRLLTRRAG